MKINTSIKLLVSTLVLLLASGCASITRGTSDALVVNSTPSQAEVKIYRTNGSFTEKEIKNNKVEDSENPSAGPIIGKTPASFKLARKGEYKVTISKNGYETAEVIVTNKISGAGGAGMAGNVLFGGFIGAGVDATTGAMKDLTPNPINVTLTKAGETTAVEKTKEAETTVADKEKEMEAAAAEKVKETEAAVEKKAEEVEKAVEKKTEEIEASKDK